MAFKISSGDKKKTDLHIEELRKDRCTVEWAITVYNAAVAAAHEALAAVVVTYNEKLSTAHGSLEDIHRELDEQFDGKSEKWQGSDKAEIIQAWIEEIADQKSTFNHVSHSSALRHTRFRIPWLVVPLNPRQYHA